LKTIKFFALAALLVLSAGNARSASRDIYPDPAQAKADLATALKTAATTHKRILLDFGGNWCPDCQVLDIYFHDPANRRILEAHLARQYEVPLRRGVPALAVLDEHGKLLYSQKRGEFEAMSRMESAEVTKFLKQWEPGRPCSMVMVNC
jgi:thiol-disulfide isomerase/thioredoxin